MDHKLGAVVLFQPIPQQVGWNSSADHFIRERLEHHARRVVHPATAYPVRAMHNSRIGDIIFPGSIWMVELTFPVVLANSSELVGVIFSKAYGTGYVFL